MNEMTLTNCKVCKGKGYFKGSYCIKCLGRGKLNWLEVIFGARILTYKRMYKRTQFNYTFDEYVINEYITEVNSKSLRTKPGQIVKFEDSKRVRKNLRNQLGLILKRCRKTRIKIHGVFFDYFTDIKVLTGKHKNEVKRFWINQPWTIEENNNNDRITSL